MLISIAVQACLSSFKLFCSTCNLDSFVNATIRFVVELFGLLQGFPLFFPLHPSLDSVFLVANASSVLFIIFSSVFHVIASGNTLPWTFPGDSDWIWCASVCCWLLFFQSYDVLDLRQGRGFLFLTIRLFSLKASSWLIEFLKSASNLDCMDPELSTWSLLIVSILVFRLQDLSVKVLYRFLISSVSFLMNFFCSLSVCSILSANCSNFSVALAMVK